MVLRQQLGTDIEKFHLIAGDMEYANVIIIPLGYNIEDFVPALCGCDVLGEGDGFDMAVSRIAHHAHKRPYPYHLPAGHGDEEFGAELLLPVFKHFYKCAAAAGVKKILPFFLRLDE
jgi:hypothetical protein